jgi:Tfp pilus assembly protein PilN
VSAEEGPRRPRGGRAKPAPPSSLLANLASAPFINRRPVQRFIVAAWATGVLLIAVNVLLWIQYRHQSTELRTRLASTRQAIDLKSRHIVEVNDQLRGLRLPAQNAQVTFLNQRIAERTFPWSLLFERIASTLPDGVRLISLSPVFTDRKAGAAPAKKEPAKKAPEEEVVSLKIHGAAQSDQALYELIDRFFASPAFANPRLYQENSSAGEVEFNVDVDYKPRYHETVTHDADATAENDATAEEGGETVAAVPAQRDAPAADDAAAAVRGRKAGDAAATAGATAPGAATTSPRLPAGGGLPAAPAAKDRAPSGSRATTGVDPRAGRSLLDASREEAAP